MRSIMPSPSLEEVRRSWVLCHGAEQQADSSPKFALPASFPLCGLSAEIEPT
jgi:hypothetical protein